jgi:hypothetical protein
LAVSFGAFPIKIRLDIGPVLPACLTHEFRFDVREANVIGPLSAFGLAHPFPATARQAMDEGTSDARLARAKSYRFCAPDHSNSMARSIAGDIGFFTLIQKVQRPAQYGLVPMLGPDSLGTSTIQEYLLQRVAET